MWQQTRTGTEIERKEFVQKLGRFRESLPDHEKAMLDAVMVTAEGARGPADLEAYHRFWGDDPATPHGYSGILPPGETSSWWENHNTPWD
jgi:hypothetical protein